MGFNHAWKHAPLALAVVALLASAAFAQSDAPVSYAFAIGWTPDTTVDYPEEVCVGGNGETVAGAYGAYWTVTAPLGSLVTRVAVQATVTEEPVAHPRQSGPLQAQYSYWPVSLCQGTMDPSVAKVWYFSAAVGDPYRDHNASYRIDFTVWYELDGQWYSVEDSKRVSLGNTLIHLDTSPFLFVRQLEGREEESTLVTGQAFGSWKHASVAYLLIYRLSRGEPSLTWIMRQNITIPGGFQFDARPLFDAGILEKGPLAPLLFYEVLVSDDPNVLQFLNMPAIDNVEDRTLSDQFVLKPFDFSLFQAADADTETHQLKYHLLQTDDAFASAFQGHIVYTDTELNTWGGASLGEAALTAGHHHLLLTGVPCPTSRLPPWTLALFYLEDRLEGHRDHHSRELLAGPQLIEPLFVPEEFPLLRSDNLLQLPPIAEAIDPSARNIEDSPALYPGQASAAQPIADSRVDINNFETEPIGSLVYGDFKLVRKGGGNISIVSAGKKKLFDEISVPQTWKGATQNFTFADGTQIQLQAFIGMGNSAAGGQVDFIAGSRYFGTPILFLARSSTSTDQLSWVQIVTSARRTIADRTFEPSQLPMLDSVTEGNHAGKWVQVPNDTATSLFFDSPGLGNSLVEDKTDRAPIVEFKPNQTLEMHKRFKTGLSVKRGGKTSLLAVFEWSQDLGIRIGRRPQDLSWYMMGASEPLQYKATSDAAEMRAFIREMQLATKNGYIEAATWKEQK